MDGMPMITATCPDCGRGNLRDVKGKAHVVVEIIVDGNSYKGSTNIEVENPALYCPNCKHLIYKYRE